MERRFSWLLRNKWKYILGEWGGSRFFMIKWVGGGCEGILWVGEGAWIFFMGGWRWIIVSGGIF